MTTMPDTMPGTMPDTLAAAAPALHTAAIHPQVAAAPLQDTELILLVDAGEALVLNASGALVWQGIEHGDDMAALAARLTAHYTVTPATAYADLLAFLTTLAEAGAIVIA